VAMIWGAFVKAGGEEESEMTREDAMETLEQLPEEEFQEFFVKLPGRTQMLLKGGLVDWRDVLPEWYIKIMLDSQYLP